MTATAFRAAGRKDVGRKRKANQDWFDITDIEHPNGVYHLLILADGMGGGVKGDVASETAVEAVVHYFGSARWYNPEDACREAVFSANRAVWDKGTGGGQATKSFMGTTLVFALVESVTNRAWLANVGDSRAYVLRQGVLEQLTRDHSVVADFSHEGPPLSPEEIARLRNVVTRAIGLEATVAPDIFGPFELEPGERILLSSDGLHGVIRDDRIQRLATAPDMERAIKSLIAAANGAGGPDNITVVMGGREAGAAASAGIPTRTDRRLVVAGVGLVAVGIVALVAALAPGPNWLPGVSGGATPTVTPLPTPPATGTSEVATATATSSAATAVPFAMMTKPVAIGKDWNCDTTYDDVRRTSGLVSPDGALIPQAESLRLAFFRAIDTSKPVQNDADGQPQTCENANYLSDRELSWPTCTWLAARPDIQKPNDAWKCPQ